MLPAQQSKQVGHENNNYAEPVQIWRARNFIHEHFDEKLSLPRIARLANISTNYLSEKFKEVTGENLVRYIARVRIEKAKQLLDDAHLRVSEIAFAVGFQSLSQFNRTFKKLFGKSPSQYREELKKRGIQTDSLQPVRIRRRNRR